MSDKLLIVHCNCPHCDAWHRHQIMDRSPGSIVIACRECGLPMALNIVERLEAADIVTILWPDQDARKNHS